MTSAAAVVCILAAWPIGTSADPTGKVIAAAVADEVSTGSTIPMPRQRGFTGACGYKIALAGGDPAALVADLEPTIDVLRRQFDRLEPALCGSGRT